ncbi:Maf family protein [Shewanella gelidii]|uniref:7-methyl-GTP pyrophosphatase n=1 Tax=Shewanella gelidii TaxID=1642821 RepID=A0A917N8T9_9GAMM|nr:nucleoside triphosphate pyrophosphatase [Shewanella gelidii]MCL1099493.1 Maf-like protein [Shewanella gelidii]GGI77364.1 Maf-like protein [Shewanella gelidii]
MSSRLILASTSTFRQNLLKKLSLPFTCISPDVDETAQENESPQQLVERLAIAKAKAGADKSPSDSIIIGSDQVAVIEQEIVGKPLTHANAVAQLQRCSGQRITFYTGLALYHKQSNTLQSAVEPFHVQFRTLSDAQIEAYLMKEQPYQCAGSFMCEGLGIALFDALEGRDPNTLVGLPLILLSEMLRAQGIEVLS